VEGGFGSLRGASGASRKLKSAGFVSTGFTSSCVSLAVSFAFSTSAGVDAVSTGATVFGATNFGATGFASFGSGTSSSSDGATGCGAGFATTGSATGAGATTGFCEVASSTTTVTSASAAAAIAPNLNPTLRESA